MTVLFPLLVPALAGLEPPLTPDRDEARRRAAEELAKPQYPAAQAGWIENLWQGFLDWLSGLQGDISASGNDVAVPLIGALAVVLAVAAVIMVRPRLNARHKVEDEVFGTEARVDAAAYRSRAQAAAARGDWPAAVVEQFRALVRSAEYRTLIDARPGRTADEVALQLGEVFGPLQQRLGSAAGLFDAVRYGKAGATESDHALVAGLDAELETTKPDFAGQASPGFAVPR